MDNLTTKTEVSADTAEAEQNVAATELGKFKDVKALMDAYTNLEAEFTRRSQRLRELERATSEQPVPERSANTDCYPSVSGVSSDGDLLENVMKNESVKKAIIEEYLRNVSSNKSVQLLSGGMQVPSPRRSPQSVKEAGKLAQEFFK